HEEELHPTTPLVAVLSLWYRNSAHVGMGIALVATYLLAMEASLILLVRPIITASANAPYARRLIVRVRILAWCVPRAPPCAARVHDRQRQRR
ncbi:hypothetical protein OFC56_31980, partial [Escherichia coli]|nr:hypothetical protein [Escherichia coli]